MNDEFVSYVVVAAIGVVIGMMIGSALGSNETSNRIHKSAIESSVGEYDAITGEFKWKESK